MTSTFSTLHLISGLDTLTDSETNKQSDRQTDSHTVRQTVRWTGMQSDEFLVFHTHTHNSIAIGKPKVVVVGSFRA